ncbi:Branched-chain amino acid transport system permease protein LivM [Candidatus Burkholderia verschuerenii]|uniref:Branched-chain amino acid transport system permease protein LivM n=1 Tax=Candidatus Burkholderia verschuerenii TaxID=242163 RepID=A0A0L0MIJ2_9BURK|nr:branched-chain amino acid ABC transporter permease [Candidatus Burkholderia verschuerenii]KND62101.1 Branched-chain amino acid transport system permease protein LivM [Candidatus Burkholderia verschuerenii]
MEMSQSWAVRRTRADVSGYVAVALVALAVLIPFLSTDQKVYSITNQILIAVPAALSVYLMLRINLISFAVPAFMCIGGYASAWCALNATTNLVVLTGVSFFLPMLIALPLGVLVLVLVLRGVYFVLVTYVLSEIVQLLLFEFSELTGGANGLTGVPAPSFGSIDFMDNRSVLLIATGLALIAVLIVWATLRAFRDPFDGIRENELLARSLGLVVWHYKALAFCLAAGLAGLAGFSLVNMLLMAHPSSFAANNGVTYIAYAIIGGQGGMLGAIVGAGLLVWATAFFSIGGEYSNGLFGLLVMIIVLVAPSGVAGVLGKIGERLLAAVRSRGHGNLSGASPREARE